MTFEVLLSPEARDDLLRLHEFLVERALYVEDLEVAERAVQTIEAALATLSKAPFIFRKDTATRSSLRRECVVPFGASGYVMKYEIASPSFIVVLAVRHQLEGDYR